MKLFAALREDTQQGWVWLQNPTFRTRSIVRITNPNNKKSIYCEALQIDKNYLNTYNQSPRFTISNPQESLVINGWYRDRLGNLSTQSDVQLNITPCNSLWGNWWGKLRACTDHPQIVVRVAFWLGAIGLFLGVIGFMLSVIGLYQKV